MDERSCLYHGNRYIGIAYGICVELPHFNEDVLQNGKRGLQVHLCNYIKSKSGDWDAVSDDDLGIVWGRRWRRCQIKKVLYGGGIFDIFPRGVKKVVRLFL